MEAGSWTAAVLEAGGWMNATTRAGRSGIRGTRLPQREPQWRSHKGSTQGGRGLRRSLNSSLHARTAHKANHVNHVNHVNNVNHANRSPYNPKSPTSLRTNTSAPALFKCW